MAQYFTGQREVTGFIIEPHDGKARLLCTVKEEWILINQETVRCGANATYKLTRRVGLSRTDTSALEGAITASIGVKGLAQLQSAIKQSVSTEITWDEVVETERTFDFSAPECGYYMALQYQLVRRYDLHYQHRGWLRKNSWRRKIVEFTPFYHDDSKRGPLDDSCNCNKPAPAPYDGAYYLDFGDKSLVVDYRNTPEGMELDFQGQKVTIDLSEYTSDESTFSAGVSREYIPEELLFLSRDESEVCHGTFTLYEEPSIIEEGIPVIEMSGDLEIEDEGTPALVGASVGLAEEDWALAGEEDYYAEEDWEEDSEEDSAMEAG